MFKFRAQLKEENRRLKQMNNIQRIDLEVAEMNRKEFHDNFHKLQDVQIILEDLDETRKHINSQIDKLKTN